MFENNAQAGLLIQMFITYAQGQRAVKLADPQNFHSAAPTQCLTPGALLPTWTGGAPAEQLLKSLTSFMH